MSQRTRQSFRTAARRLALGAALALPLSAIATAAHAGSAWAGGTWS